MTHYRFDDDGNLLPPIPKSITEINNYVKELIDEEALLQDIYAVGEISTFKNHVQSGHLYFTLKDEKSEIRAIMFRAYAQKLKFKPENGMKVVVHARLSVYPQAGTYQMYVDSMQPDGVGELHFAFEQLKERLNKEGLFLDEHKKDLPKFPRAIGIVTSSSGAAIRDIIKVATKRSPQVKLVLFPSLVQGSEAPYEIIRGIEYFNIENNVDVIIVGRGGGSMEDLWAFNDEMLARTVYNSKIPIISAVGHEIDYTICDFVADVRAATPSHAAELATPDVTELKNRINDYGERIVFGLTDTLSAYRARLDDLANSRCFIKPMSLIELPSLKLMNLSEKLVSSAYSRVRSVRDRFINLNSKLSALNPMAVLSRGYGAVFNQDSQVVKSINDIKIDEKINIKLNDGTLRAVVIDVEGGNDTNG